MAREFSLSCHLQSDPETVRERVMDPALFVHVAAPILRVKTIDQSGFGARWQEGEYRIAMRLFGVVPIGWQAIVIDLSDGVTAQDKSNRIFRDRGYGPTLRQWDHCAMVEKGPGGGAVYTDALRIDAGVMTPLVALFAKAFFRHRQGRLMALDKAGFEGLGPA